ncbi:MAG TPA: hypothetical protein VI159_11800 [Gemmatimonadales bacterium]
MRKALSASIGAMVFVAACGTKPLPTSGGGLGGINGRDQISALWDTSGTALTSSGEVESGYQFTVSFKTVAGGCLSPDYVAVQGAGSSVTVTPFDLNSGGPGLMCPMSLTSAERNTQVVLTAPGLDTVRLRGMVGFGESARLVTVQKIIKVLPAP